MGKGSRRRPSQISPTTYAANFDRIFGSASRVGDEDRRGDDALVDAVPVDLHQRQESVTVRYGTGEEKARRSTKADG